MITLGELIKNIPEGYFNVRISQLGRCHRSFQYSLLGIPQEAPPDKTRKMWDDRQEDESRIIKIISKKFKRVKEDKRTFIRIWKNSPYKKARIVFSSTPDGMLFDKESDSWIPIEIKSLNPFRFSAINSQEDLSREYLIQVYGEMLLVESKKALFVIGDSKSKKDLKTFNVTLDERAIGWIFNRLSYIFQFINSNEIIYPEFLPGSSKCRWCLYKKRCEQDNIYKGFFMTYNRSGKINRGDFEFEKIKSLYKNILSSIKAYNDSLFNLKQETHEFRDFLLKRKVNMFENFPKLSMDYLKRITALKELKEV